MAHPPLDVPGEELLEDLLRDEDDAVFVHGQSVAREIQEGAELHGRCRLEYRKPARIDKDGTIAHSRVRQPTACSRGEDRA